MPIVVIKILEGRGVDKKRRLIESVSRAVAESLDMPIDGVRVVIDESSPASWGRGGRTVADLMTEGAAKPPPA